MVKLLKKHGFAPSRVVTDRLRSYPAALRAIGLTAEHDRRLRANNRAENSHQPIRRRERKLQRFKSPGSAQRFLAVHAATFNAFTHQRHLLRRPHFKELRAGSFGPGHPPPHDACCPLRSPQLNADNVTKPADVLRSMIDRIDLHPRDDGNGVDATLHGDLAQILTVCAESDGNEKLPKAGASGSPLSVVAGARSHLYRTRLHYAREGRK